MSKLPIVLISEIISYLNEYEFEKLIYVDNNNTPIINIKLLIIIDRIINLHDYDEHMTLLLMHAKCYNCVFYHSSLIFANFAINKSHCAYIVNKYDLENAKINIKNCGFEFNPCNIYKKNDILFYYDTILKIDEIIGSMYIEYTNDDKIKIIDKEHFYIGDYSMENNEIIKFGEGKLITDIGTCYGIFKNNDLKYGKIIFPNRKYEGDICDYIPYGKGTMIHNSNIINGEWIDECNVNGTIKFSNGDIFIGTCLYNLNSGNGKMIYKNGDIYEGTINNNCFVDGKMIHKNGIIRKGIWKNNLLKYGEIIFPNKKTVIGSHLDIDEIAKGEIIYENGNIYEGEISECKPYGWGKMKTKFNFEYSGSFTDGKYDYKIKYKNSDIILGNEKMMVKYSNNTRYIGNYVLHNSEYLKHGKGVITDKNYKLIKVTRYNYGKTIKH